MIARKIFKHAFLFLAIVGALNLIAIKFYLYWSLHYFDSGVHFLAGISVGFAAVWWVTRKDTTEVTGRSIVYAAVLGAIGIGILWEIFELSFDITSFSDGIHYVTDTSADLLMDTCGGLIAGLYSRSIFKQ